MKTTRYTRKQHDVLELITHLILTKPKVVIKLLNKYGVRFKFRPQPEDLINELVELLKERNDSFYSDLNRLLSIHVEHKGMEIMALELGQEDNFLGGLVGGIVKPLLGGIFGGGSKPRPSNNGAAQAAAQAQAQAAKMKAEMEAKMQRMEAERRRQEEEARRRREEEERRRRREEEDRRRREEENRRRQAEQRRATNNDSDKDKPNYMLYGIIGVAVLGVVGAIAMKSKTAA